MIMKKVILGFTVVAVLFATSCKKNSDNLGQGGSWTFKSSNYNAYKAIFYTDSFNATTQSPSNPSNYDYVSVKFSSSASLAPGNYQVVSYSNPLYGGGYIVNIEFVTSTGNKYTSTGGGGNQFVQVSVSNAMMSISVSGITLRNANNPTDSSTLTINLTQTR